MRQARAAAGLILSFVVATANAIEPAQHLCLYCHTPAAGPLAQGARPAWGGGQIADAARSSAVVSPTMNVYGDHAESMVCLSCHDGSIGAGHGAMGIAQVLDGSGDIFQKLLGGGGDVAAAPALGRDPQAEHPVAIHYNDFDTKGYRSRAELRAAGLPLYGPGRDQVECTTCHDPHSNRHGSYLRMPNSRSKLCLTCHNK